MSRTVDDEIAQVEARLIRWLDQQPDHYSIDLVARLIQGKQVEAVITNLRTGRQGLWPVAWDVDVESLPLFRPAPKRQAMLF